MQAVPRAGRTSSPRRRGSAPQSAGGSPRANRGERIPAPGPPEGGSQANSGQARAGHRRDDRPHPDEGQGDVEPREHGQPDQDTSEPRAWMDEGPIPRIYRGEERRNGEEYHERGVRRSNRGREVIRGQDEEQQPVAERLDNVLPRAHYEMSSALLERRPDLGK